MPDDSKRAQAKHLEGYNRRSRTICRFQTGALKMEEKMSQNDVEKNGGKIEEYMVRAEKIVDSLHAWQESGNWRRTGHAGFYQGPI